jgi:xanthine dehydrogenase accessory factor
VKSVWDACQHLLTEGTPFVVVTMVGVRGSAPQDVGAKAIVVETGLFYGTIGGGKIEAHCIRHSQALLAKSECVPVLETWNLQRDIGMSCGGEGTYLFEIFRPSQWSVAIFGAGHVAQALARVLEPMNCRLTFVDPREEWIQRLPESPRVQRVLTDDPPGFVAKLPAGTFYCVMTRGHSSDMPVLEAIFRHAPTPVYVGVIGSDVKGLKIRKELAEKGVSSEFIERLRVPMGLPIGGNEPAEIAVSIAAELLQTRGALK